MSMATRNPHPASPPIVPGSSVRMRLIHATSSADGASSASAGEIRSSTTIPVATPITPSDSTPSHAISAIGPLAIVLSNA